MLSCRSRQGLCPQSSSHFPTEKKFPMSSSPTMTRQVKNSFLRPYPQRTNFFYRLTFSKTVILLISSWLQPTTSLAALESEKLALWLPTKLLANKKQQCNTGLHNDICDQEITWPDDGTDTTCDGLALTANVTSRSIAHLNTVLCNIQSASKSPCTANRFSSKPRFFASSTTTWSINMLRQRTPLKPISSNIKPGYELTPYQRGLIVGGKASGARVCDIVLATSRSKSTVLATLRKAVERTEGESKPRSGRPKLYSDRVKRNLIRHCRLHPKHTYAQVRKALNSKISTSSIKRIFVGLLTRSISSAK